MTAKSKKLCACGEAGPPLTKKQISGFNKLRGYNIIVCVCGHEVYRPRTAHDVRKLGSIDNKMAHAACVTARAPQCSVMVNEPGSVLGRRCRRKSSTKDKIDGKPVCSWHQNGRIFATPKANAETT